MHWSEILMDAIAIAVIGVAGAILAAIIAELFMAHRVSKKIDGLPIEKEHRLRKTEP